VDFVRFVNKMVQYPISQLEVYLRALKISPKMIQKWEDDLDTILAADELVIGDSVSETSLEDTLVE